MPKSKPIFNKGDRVKPRGREGFATHTVVKVSKDLITTKPDFRLGENTICVAKPELWVLAGDDSNTAKKSTVQQVESEKVYETIPESDIAKKIAKARWQTLKNTVADIAVNINCTEQDVNNVIESDKYTEIVKILFTKYKGWKTWAKKPKTTAKKIAERFWIEENDADAIISKISQ